MLRRSMEYVLRRSDTHLEVQRFPPQFRFALLLLDAQARRSADFAQNVAENRGIQVQVFFAREPALQWLLA